MLDKADVGSRMNIFSISHSSYQSCSWSSAISFSSASSWEVSSNTMQRSLPIKRITRNCNWVPLSAASSRLVKLLEHLSHRCLISFRLYMVVRYYRSGSSKFCSPVDLLPLQLIARLSDLSLSCLSLESEARPLANISHGTWSHSRSSTPLWAHGYTNHQQFQWRKYQQCHTPGEVPFQCHIIQHRSAAISRSDSRHSTRSEREWSMEQRSSSKIFRSNTSRRDDRASSTSFSIEHENANGQCFLCLTFYEPSHVLFVCLHQKKRRRREDFSIEFYCTVGQGLSLFIQYIQTLKSSAKRELHRC